MGEEENIAPVMTANVSSITANVAILLYPHCLDHKWPWSKQQKQKKLEEPSLSACKQLDSESLNIFLVGSELAAIDRLFINI